MGNAEREFIRNRVNVPTAKSSREIARDIPEQIRARAFFSARVAESRILDRFRQISDDYSGGRIGRDEARALMREFARASGKDDGSAGLKNLASTARLELILNQNAKMARAVGDYDRMYSPANREAFPYLLYQASVGSKTPRSEHKQHDGKIFHKDDPWLRAHWPPSEFGCNCRLKNISRKTAEASGMIQPMTPPEKAVPDSRSGFSFDPAHAFATSDVSNLQPISRAEILRQAEEAVRDQKLGTVGLITAPPVRGLPPEVLPKLNTVKAGFESMKAAARAELEAVGLDPDNLPDYKTVNQAFDAAGRQGKNIATSVRDQFPAADFDVGKLNARAAEAAGIPQLPVVLGRGNSHHGIEHLWRNHKELFADPDKAAQLLQETLGDPNCRVVVSMKRAMVTQRGKKVPICLKRIVLHNPETQTYCVMVQSDNQLRLVSWNNAGDDYGDAEWSLE